MPEHQGQPKFHRQPGQRGVDPCLGFTLELSVEGTSVSGGQSRHRGFPRRQQLAQ
jgi:hypothetical protein